MIIPGSTYTAFAKPKMFLEIYQSLISPKLKTSFPLSRLTARKVIPFKIRDGMNVTPNLIAQSGPNEVHYKSGDGEKKRYAMSYWVGHKPFSERNA